jgi:hypothetical protein
MTTTTTTTDPNPSSKPPKLLGKKECRSFKIMMISVRVGIVTYALATI